MRRGGKGGEVIRALVIGLGNPLRGDDGVGHEVIRRLRRGHLDGLMLVETDGHDLVEWLSVEGFDRVAIVDAADLGQAPGTWVRLTPEVLRVNPVGLTHGMGLVEALGLLEAIGVRPAPIVIFAVQPGAVGWAPGLSRAVRHAVPAVADAIRQELLPPPPGGRTVLRIEQDVRCLPCGANTA